MAEPEEFRRMTEFAPPDALATANMLRRALAALGRPMRSLRADHGIAPAKLGILGRLERAGRAMTATELAAHERLQPQSLTRIVADLEEHGLIVRNPRESDRRQIDIAITPEGSRLIRRDAHKQALWLAAAMEASLNPAERTILALAAELLDRIADHPIDEIGNVAGIKIPARSDETISR
jgi:DNA-binding MarR family transcriptional regulator